MSDDHDHDHDHEDPEPAADARAAHSHATTTARAADVADVAAASKVFPAHGELPACRQLIGSLDDIESGAAFTMMSVDSYRQECRGHSEGSEA